MIKKDYFRLFFALISAVIGVFLISIKCSRFRLVDENKYYETIFNNSLHQTTYQDYGIVVIGLIFLCIFYFLLTKTSIDSKKKSWILVSVTFTFIAYGLYEGISSKTYFTESAEWMSKEDVKWKDEHNKTIREINTSNSNSTLKIEDYTPTICVPPTDTSIAIYSIIGALLVISSIIKLLHNNQNSIKILLKISLTLVIVSIILYPIFNQIFHSWQIDMSLLPAILSALSITILIGLGCNYLYKKYKMKTSSDR